MPVVSVSMTIQGASAKNAYCVYGVPSPFTYIGFAHALTARAGVRQEGGVVAVIHNYSDRGVAGWGDVGPSWRYSNIRSAEREVPGCAQHDIPKLNLQVSVLLDLEGESEHLLERLEDQMPGMRFAGGSIVKSHVGIFESFEMALAKMPFGFLMCEAELPESGDSLETLIKETALARNKAGWKVPSLAGFRLIESPCRRPGARGEHPHAYADPLIGAIEFRSIRTEGERIRKHRWFLSRQENIIRFITKRRVTGE